MSGTEHIVHPFEPVFDERSRVLLLGTMPSPRSRADGFYYGHPRNRFWNVLAAVFNEPAPTTNERKRDFLLRHHLALWDVLAACDIEGASDASITAQEPNDIAHVLASAPIEAVFCTGAKAAELYARLCEPTCGMPATRLPSTSPANAACSFEDLVEAYGAVAAHERPFDPPTLDVPGVVALEQAIAAAGTPLSELMNRAGTALAFHACAIAPVAPARVCVLCGSGNNGGDGWVAAAELARHGHDVVLVTSREPSALTAQPAAETVERIMSETPVSWTTSEEALEGADLIIDAILGTGFTGARAKEPYATWIRAANRQRNRGARIVAADVPSPGIRADLVVTMIVPKPGLGGVGCPVVVAPLAYIEDKLETAETRETAHMHKGSGPTFASRTRMLLGADAMDALARSRVAVFGLGGVGGHAAEAIARAGVGAIDVIDHDLVNITNVNRQTVAALSTIGRPKVEVMAERIADINPACHVRAHRCFYLPDSKDGIDLADYDYIIDAVDTVTAKLLLIGEANACGTPIISCMGAANKLDPTAFEVADIYDTRVCPLAKIIRKECRKRGIAALKVVYSTEPAHALFPDDSGEETSRRSGIPGSTAFVPAVCGLIAAAEVVRDLSGKANGEGQPLSVRSRAESAVSLRPPS